MSNRGSRGESCGSASYQEWIFLLMLHPGSQRAGSWERCGTQPGVFYCACVDSGDLFRSRHGSLSKIYRTNMGKPATVHAVAQGNPRPVLPVLTQFGALQRPFPRLGHSWFCITEPPKISLLPPALFHCGARPSDQGRVWRL